VVALGDQADQVRENACRALGAMGEKAATSQVIDRLVVALGDQDGEVRDNACRALGAMGEKAATSQVIDRLVVSLGDQSYQNGNWKSQFFAIMYLTRWMWQPMMLSTHVITYLTVS
ncbi:unnamed protein product, partial [Rotaria magnacalcarata]